MSDMTVSQIGFPLVIFGFILALVAVILLAIRSKTGGSKTRGGAVLFIGPIPIIFGTDRESAKILVALTIILMAVVLVFMLLPSLLTR